MNQKQIFRTGLAVMLAGLFYIVAFCSSISFAEEPKPEPDSLILAKHLRESKIEYAIEEFSDHSFNSHYSDKQLDSILNESRISFPSAKFVYAPDSAFKIAVIEGESCGAYCNPFWKSWFHFNDGSGMMLSGTKFENVTAIEKLIDGKYLIWESTYGRGGAIGYYTTTATLLSLNAHQINYHTFPEIPSHERFDDTNNPMGSFSVYQTTDGEEELECNFIPETQKLIYQYSMDPFWSTEDDTCAVYSGWFLYKNGQFEFQTEICKTEKPQ